MTIFLEQIGFDRIFGRKSYGRNMLVPNPLVQLIEGLSDRTTDRDFEKASATL